MPLGVELIKSIYKKIKETFVKTFAMYSCHSKLILVYHNANIIMIPDIVVES